MTEKMKEYTIEQVKKMDKKERMKIARLIWEKPDTNAC